MKKTIIFIISISFFSFLSCKHEVSSPKSFIDLVDLTYNNKEGITSIFIDSSKLMKVRIIDPQWRYYNFQDTLHDTVFCKINQLFKHAMMVKHDSVIKRPTCFTTCYYLYVSYQKQNTHVLVYEEPDYSYQPLDTITKLLYQLSHKIKRHAFDTTYVFKSYSRVAGPPPPIKELTKFIPPKMP